MSEQRIASLWDLSDLCTPWCIHVVATLRIADKIAAGTDKIADLAAAAGCDAGILHSILGHLVGKGVFEEVEPGRFALNETARQLLDPIVRLSLDLDSIGGRMASAWGTLLTFVRTGAPAYRQLFGKPFWEDLAAHPRIAADFDTLIGPAGHGDFSPEFQITGGWESIHAIVDVGGGTGAMLAERYGIPLKKGVPAEVRIATASASVVARSSGSLPTWRRPACRAIRSKLFPYCCSNPANGSNLPSAVPIRVAQSFKSSSQP